MKSAVIDFQAFSGLGTAKFIVKEVSIMDLETLRDRNFLFKPPKEIPEEGGRSTSDRWLKRNFHHLEWSQGDIEYSMMHEVLSNSTKKFKFLFAKGMEKCDFLEEMLGQFVYDLEQFGCPGLKKLAEAVKCERCPHHAGKTFVCAHRQTQGLAKWAISNRERINLLDQEVRLNTFRRWSVLMDPVILSGAGFVQMQGGYKSAIKCVYCGLELLKVSCSDNIEENHRALSPSCSTFKCNKVI